MRPVIWSSPASLSKQVLADASLLPQLTQRNVNKYQRVFVSVIKDSWLLGDAERKLVEAYAHRQVKQEVLSSPAVQRKD